MFKFKLQYWPIITSIWFTLTYFISYFIAISYGHVHALFPYISDTGTSVPESCVFGQMLNIGALLMYLTMYLRYKLVQFYEDDVNSKFYKWFNVSAYYIGIMGVLGMSIVANFQETNNLAIHLLGASLAFGCGCIYLSIQAWLTLRSNVSTILKCIRLFTSILFTPMYISTMLCGSLALSQFKGTNVLLWNKNDGGYDLHLVATFSEWSLAILLNLFILSNASEFERIKFDQVVFKRNF